MSPPTAVLVAFAGSRVVLEWEGPVGARVVGVLFHGAPRVTALAARQLVRLRVSETRRRFRLHRDDLVLWEGTSAWGLARALASMAVQQIVETGDAGPLFHAASACHQGRGLLLPGGPGAGKSSLCAWLAAQGFDSLGDELALVRGEGVELSALGRAWHFRRPVAPSIRKLLPHAPCLTGRGGAFFAASGWRAAHRAPVDLRWIVFPRYVRGARLRIRRLTRGQSALRLMTHLVNARGLGLAGFEACARIARAVPAFTLRYSRFEQLEGPLGEALDERVPA